MIIRLSPRKPTINVSFNVSLSPNVPDLSDEGGSLGSESDLDEWVPRGPPNNKMASARQAKPDRGDQDEEKAPATTAKHSTSDEKKKKSSRGLNQPSNTSKGGKVRR